MTVTAERKRELAGRFGSGEGDTGRTEVQVALMTERIVHLTEHVKLNHKDHSSRRGLIKIVNHRRALLEYLKRKNLDRYRKLIDTLGLRK